MWHAVENISGTPALLINAVNKAYRYESPVHFRLPLETNQIRTGSGKRKATPWRAYPKQQQSDASHRSVSTGASRGLHTAGQEKRHNLAYCVEPPPHRLF